jgi:hypothetical protein
MIFIRLNDGSVWTISRAHPAGFYAQNREKYFGEDYNVAYARALEDKDLLLHWVRFMGWDNYKGYATK